MANHLDDDRIVEGALKINPRGELGTSKPVKRRGPAKENEDFPPHRPDKNTRRMNAAARGGRSRGALSRVQELPQRELPAFAMGHDSNLEPQMTARRETQIRNHSQQQLSVFAMSHDSNAEAQTPPNSTLMQPRDHSQPWV